MSNKKPVPGYIWMLAGLAIGFFAAFLVYLDKQPAEKVTFTEAIKQELKNARQQKKLETAKKATQDTGKKTADTREKPRFEFYTILSELEVFVPEPEIEEDKPHAQPQKNSQINNEKKYLLQAGSFRSQVDAERLKANLALLGVQSSIQSVTINSDSWHRVRIGPFSSNLQLRETLGTLKQNNIHAMTMELK
ncbi:hypothetical protein MNBD_GAMMA09-49 [hydrothermal vent metagenome]|uniref:SPOR domain-containing protein n=1 Tax=hydrothermal vent metagenome TaxID=652676 RepID=A0A3B0XNV7_9ZZZZ